MLFAARSSIFAPNEFVIINAKANDDATVLLLRYLPETWNYAWLFNEFEKLEEAINWCVEVSATNKKYVLDRLILLPIDRKVKMPDGTEGLNCNKCGQYFPYSEGNQLDGSLICYECRFGLVKK